jgi:plastocyanin
MRIVLLIAAASLLLAACGGDDEENGEETTPAAGAATTTAGTGAATTGAGAAPQATIDIIETDFKLTPSGPTVDAGQITFNVSNDGQTIHSLEVEGPTGESELESELAPGESGSMVVDLSEPGTYEMYCPVDGHRGQGMVGEITVR